MANTGQVASSSARHVRAIPLGQLGAVWGVLGIVVLLSVSIIRVSSYARETIADGLNWYQWGVLLLSTATIAYLEGYRGFQKRLAPRVAARARYLWTHPDALLIVLSPLFCLGYFRSTWSRKIGTLAITVAIVIVSFFMKSVATPWRGIIDAGVAVGLTWGLASIVMISARALTADDFPHSPGIPDDSR